MINPRYVGFAPALVLLVGCALCAVTAAVTVSGTPSDSPALEALARVFTVAAPIAAGAYALRRPPFARFGRLLIAAGAAWFLTTLSNASAPVPYSIGRVAGWVVEPLLLYLVLAFPTGRLRTGTDRALVGGMLVLVVTLFLPTALLVERYPVPVPWTSCDASCPANAFMLTGSEPAFIDDVVRPLRELLTAGLFVAVTVRLAYRIRASTRPVHRTLGPILAVACVRSLAYAGGLVTRQVAPDFSLVDVWVWLIALSVPLMALAFLLGLARWWLFIAASTQRLAARLHGQRTPDALRDALSDVFDDPGLVVAYRVGGDRGHWADATDGQRIDAPPSTSGRGLTEVRDGDRLVAAIIHDAALADDQAFIDTASSYALMTLDNHRLSGESRSLLHEVRESRARIQAAADDERRRIQRDLHDGAQQRLVALRIGLVLAAERTDGDEDAAAALREFGGDVDAALEEVRALAGGLFPAPLADHGLVEGLRSAALGNPLPVTVGAEGVERYANEIESAAYFVCVEALQNAAKHASGATSAVIELADDGALHLDVRDDGAGFDPATVEEGSGLVNMRDRLAAVGGELEIASAPGRGTRVSATIPLR